MDRVVLDASAALRIASSSAGFDAVAGIASLEEARAYMDHPVLGLRLRECVGAVLATSGVTAEQIFGALAAMKVRSSMTLFHRAAPAEPLFAEMLERFYGGVADEATDALLS